PDRSDFGPIWPALVYSHRAIGSGRLATIHGPSPEFLFWPEQAVPGQMAHIYISD
ncbi:hypothetical protein TorRG33x02_129580, partial [Trema orientale]